MVRNLLAIALCAVFISPAAADSGIRRVPCGYQQITNLSAATKLTIPAACGGAPVLAAIKAEAQAVRYRDDGTAPTASVGMPLAIDEPGLEYQGTISAIQFIEQTSGATLDVLFYR